jgi:hypothetical protein
VSAKPDSVGEGELTGHDDMADLYEIAMGDLVVDVHCSSLPSTSSISYLAFRSSQDRTTPNGIANLQPLHNPTNLTCTRHSISNTK